RWQNPLAEKDGQPGVAFRWLEVEGPIYDQWPPVGHKLLFSDLPMETKKVVAKRQREPLGTNELERELRRFIPPPGVEVTSKQPMRDAERLLRNFVRLAYRRPADETEMRRFLPVIKAGLKKGNSFTDSM